MTQMPAALPSLPLSVTCSADTRFAAALAALAGRVVADGVEGRAAERFTEALTTAVDACLAHLGDDRAQVLTVELTLGEADVQGSVRWPGAPDDPAFTAHLSTALAGLADDVVCGHRGDDAFCTVSCRRA